MKRIIAACLCAVLLTGCTSDKPAYIPTGNGLNQSTQATVPTLPPDAGKQTVSLGYHGASFLNPFQSGNSANRLVFELLYQGLFTVDAEYQVHPILCREYTVSKDLTTYVFYLQEATFSDGSALTAEDVVASLEAAAKYPVYAGRLTELNTVEVTEDGGVQVRMNIPYENLPILLDVPIVKADQVTQQWPLGTGPYRLEQGVEKLWLLRREDWWCRAHTVITADYISLTGARTPSQLRDAFEFGSVNVLCTDPGADSYVDIRCDYELWDCESGLFLYLACNENNGVFSNRTIRAALTHGVDRAALVETYYKDFALPAYLPASPESPYYDRKLAANYGYDPQVLADAVAAAELESKAVTLLVSGADSHRVRVARAVGKMLEQAGLSVTISALNGDAYTKALKNGNFDLHLGQTKLSPNMDLTAFFHAEGALSFGGLADPIAYSLCQEAMGNHGNYYSLHRTVMDNGMLCPLLFRSYAIYVGRGVIDTMEPARDHLFFYSLGNFN